MTRKFWYCVRLGERVKWEKAEDPRAACQQAFGHVFDGTNSTAKAQYKNTGSKHPRYLSNKRKAEVEARGEGWQNVPALEAAEPAPPAPPPPAEMLPQQDVVERQRYCQVLYQHPLGYYLVVRLVNGVANDYFVEWLSKHQFKFTKLQAKSTTSYTVVCEDEHTYCPCKSFEVHKTCKHVLAVEALRNRGLV